MRIAMVSGCTGQDGSYLVKMLLDLGYKVIGLKRRTSLINTDRIDDVFDNKNFEMRYWSLFDGSSINRLMKEYMPDEFYNLAAQSHVKVSFETPEETMDGILLGTCRILEAIRNINPSCRFYQASSSEMYGRNTEVPLSEESAMLPASPYACAKLAAHHLTQNYRESYGLHASSGILFNHECLEYNTPILVRYSNGNLDVTRPVDLIPHKKKGKNVQTYILDDIETWDGSKWVRLEAVTATKHSHLNDDHNILSIQTRSGVISSTSHHNLLREDFSEVRADEVKIGDKMAKFDNFPLPNQHDCISCGHARLLGLLVADGYVSKGGEKVRFSNNDEVLSNNVSELWAQIYNGYSSEITEGLSGFKDTESKYIDLLGVDKFVKMTLRRSIYDKSGYKKVPTVILNANTEAQKAFLDGYYDGDGLKVKNREGFVTNSPRLAQGLIWIYHNLGKNCTIYNEYKNGKNYFRINILQNRDDLKGAHLIKPRNTVREIIDVQEHDEWVFDIKTSSGHIAAGVGKLIVHNSPLRGETFVTRKVTRAAARIKMGFQKDLVLGNLDAKRDWGFAGDYVRGMYLMLQQEEPDDYVLATGETKTVREWVEAVFNAAEMPIEWEGSGVQEVGRYEGRAIISVSPVFFRPQEVPILLGDSSKAERVLGWKPKVSFKDLAEMMYNEDMKIIQSENSFALVENYFE